MRWLGFWAAVAGFWLVIFIFILQMCKGWCVHFRVGFMGWCVHFRGGIHVVWVGSCQWLYFMCGFHVVWVYVDVYVWL